MTTRRATPDPGYVRAALHELGYTGDDAVLVFQREWGLPDTGRLDRVTLVMVVDAHEAHQVAERHGHPHPSNAVKGLVASSQGEPAPGLDVQLVEVTLRSEAVVGSSKTDSQGHYEIAHPRDARIRSARRALLVRVLDGETVAAQSPARFDRPPLMEVDLTVDPVHVHAPTEYERLLAEVRATLGKVALTDLRDDDIGFLNGALHAPLEQLVQLVLAQRLEALSSVEAPFFYALLRQDALLGRDPSRLSVRFAVSLSTPVQPLFYDVVLLDTATVRAAVDTSIARRVVPAAVAGEVEGILATLAKSARAARRYHDVEQPGRLIDAVAANVVAGRPEQVLEILQQHGHGDPTALAGALGAVSLVPPGAAAGGGKGGEGAGTALLAADPELLADLQALARPASQGSSPAFDPATLAGTPAQAARAAQRFPTAAFTASLAAAGRSTSLHDAVVQTLEANPEFDLPTGSVDQLLRKGNVPVVAGVDSAALRERLKATQRVFKLAPNHAQTTALLDAGVHSAAQISAMGTTQFARRFSANGVFSAAEADAVFSKAHDVHIASSMLAGELRGIGTGTLAAVAGAEVADRLQLVARDNPNLHNLFALPDMCECTECRSIISPAAYLVDVLQFLRNRTVVDTTAGPPVASRSAKDVLFARRPDLGDIDLTCDNANVPLPYIDVVCELLEQLVSPDPGFAFNGVVAAGVVPTALLAALQAQGLPFTDSAEVQEADAAGNLYVRDTKVVCKLTPGVAPNTWTVRRLRQTFRAAAELAAAPEYVNDAAYLALQTSQVAFHLPFDLFHEECRAYFTQFDVLRDELMRALAKAGVPAPRDVAADALRISDAERAIIGTADVANQNVYWNTGATDPATIVNIVDTLLTRTELGYEDLQSLLERGFVNPGDTLFIHRQDLTCDTTTQDIANLDDAALDRIHRFLRLVRRLGWDMATVDHAIMAARLGNGQLTDDPFLVRVADLVRLQARLGLGVEDLIVFYGLIPTDGEPSRYAQVFLSPSANGPVEPRLQVAAVQANEALPKAARTKLGDVASAVATALGIAAPDLGLLAAALAAPPHGDDTLTFANLAALYAYAGLARSLRTSIANLLLLTDLTGIDPLASPADALRLAAEYDRLRGAGVKPVDLQFLLSFTAADVAARTLKDSAIAALLTALQAQLQAAYAQNRSPFDPTRSADENKDGLRDVVGHLPGVSQAQLADLVAVMDNGYNGPGTAAVFLDRLLGDFVDTTGIDALQATLAATPPAPPAPFEAARQALIEAILATVSSNLYAQAREAAVVDAVAAGLRLDTALAATLLRGGHLTIGVTTPTLLTVVGDDSLIDAAYTPPAPPAPPAITSGAFPHQWAAIQLLRQMAVLAVTLSLPVDDLRWLLDNAAALGWLQLDQLPYQPAMPAVPLPAWDQLGDAAGLLQRYAPVVDPGNADNVLTMRSVLDLALTGGTTIAQLLDRLAAVTGWDRTVLGDLDTRFGLSGGGLGPYLLPATYLQLESVVVPLRRLGLDVASGVALVTPQLTAADAMTLRQALKARYAEADWLGVVKQIYDPLRQGKRDALVALLLARNPDFVSSDDLFDYLLVDVEMGACQQTSRLVSAHGTLQLFVQRCQLGVEPTAVADIGDDDGWAQWTWMQSFRVWQANRKVFLYPENWLDPSVRDDKSEPFKVFEDALQQNSLNDDSVFDAVAGYLEALDDISFLEVMTACYDERTYTMHVFARTKGGDPPLYYHRRYIEEKVWTPWEKVDLDIKGNHLVSFMRSGRLQLAWPIFTAQANPDQEMRIPTSGDQGSDAPKTQQAWQIQIAVSELRNDGWSPSRTAQDPMPWNFGYSVTLPAKRDFHLVPLDQRANGFSVLTTLDIPAEGGSSIGELTADVLLGGFEMTGCKGYPVPFGDQPWTELLFLPQFRETEVADERFAETAAGNDDLSIMPVWSRRWAQILQRTPDVFRVTYPQQMALIDYIALILLLLSRAGQMGASTREQYAERRTVIPIPLGTLMPFFFEDGAHDYVVIPGWFGFDGRDKQHGTRARRTYSDILRLVQALVMLAEEYWQKLRQDPNHDLGKVLQELFHDPQWISLREQVLAYRGLVFRYEFDDFYHPLICPLRETFYRDGVDALMARSTQLQVSAFSFPSSYTPTPAVITPYPIEDVDFRPTGSYASYNWELFFHVPVNVATRLEQDQQFEKATRWLHRVFDPTDAAYDTVPRKYWQTKWFYQTTSSDYVNQRIDTIMNGLGSDPSGTSIADLAFAVEQWREKPFEPFLIARTRTVAFQVATVMQYVDNLIAWGDSLFTQDTMESVNQATQMYILADKLLGPQPRMVPSVVTPPAETYSQLEAKVDLFGNALLDLENLVPVLNLLPHHGAELPPSPLSLSSLYFCIPPNPNLLAYWGKVSDRLTKIRNCQDINGVERPLALFAPPIDPGTLIAAAAQGLSIADVLQGLNAPLPLYRFSTMAQKATELVQLVVSLGNEVLSALEKRDAEALARLRATQEISVLDAVRLVKEQQVADAQSQIEVLQRSIDVTTAKSQYYHSRQFMNAAETLALQLTAQALVPQAVALGLDTGAAVANLVPSFSVGAAGFGGSPEATVSFGGSNVGGSLSSFASVARAVGSVLQTGAGMATTLGSYLRRQDEWIFQATLADRELLQLQRQQDQARIKLAVAQADLAAHHRQISNASQTDQFLRTKFTNRELYDHMLGQISGVYFGAYQLALDIAHKAERCFQHELGSELTFVRFDSWDNLRKGLLAGQRLLNDVKRMETQYLAQNRREHELTKHVSLAQLDPLALLQLKTNGACTFDLPEAIYDLDHLGHYFRRLKTVAVTVPCVSGPYTSVSCKLSLVGNRYRRTTAILAGPDGYAETLPADDRFVYNVGAIQSIATSQGQNDSGMFELSFHDERYLPFEGQGAISGWRLELPQHVRQFDYDSITDVVLHVRYTARDGGGGFAAAASDKLAAHLSSMLVDAQRSGLHQSFDIRREFPDEWHLLLQNGSVTITLDSDRLPFFTQGHSPAVDTATWVGGVQGNPLSYPMQLDGAPFTLNSDASFAPMLKGSSNPPPLATAFTLSAANAAILEELALVIHYTVS